MITIITIIVSVVTLASIFTCKGKKPEIKEDSKKEGKANKLMLSALALALTSTLPSLASANEPMTVNGNAVGPYTLGMTSGATHIEGCTNQAITGTVERALPTALALCFAEGTLQRITVTFRVEDTDTVMGSIEAFYGAPNQEVAGQATWALRHTTLTIVSTAYGTVLSLVSNSLLAFEGRNVLNGRALQSNMTEKEWRRALRRQLDR